MKLPAIPRWVFAHRSGGEDKFVTEGGRNGASCFKQGFEMHLGGQLKTQGGFAAIASVGVAPGQQRRLGNPHSVFILP